MEQNLLKIRPCLFALEVGDTMRFPIERMKSVRTQASELGVIYNRRFKTMTNRQNRTIIVIRIK